MMIKNKTTQIRKEQIILKNFEFHEQKPAKKFKLTKTKYEKNKFGSNTIQENNFSMNE